VMARPIPERFMAVPFVEERYAFTIRPLDSRKKPPKVSSPDPLPGPVARLITAYDKAAAFAWTRATP
jgi:hypothetical protein